MPLKPWYKVVTPREDLENSFGTGFHIHFEKQIDANQLFKNSASSISCGLARSRSLVGEKPTQVAVSHGPGIQPCRCSGNPAY